MSTSIDVTTLGEGGRLREAPYTCQDCGRGWMRVTDQKLALPEVCPFCGGPGKLSREPKDLE